MGSSVSKVTKEKNIKWVYWIRALATILVLYGHLINVGTWATNITGIVSEKNEFLLPFLPYELHSLYKFCAIFSILNTDIAAIGVFLFFLLTGYLTTMTREKYSAKNFMINKILRIFPMLIITIILTAILLYLSQGIVYPWFYYVTNATLMYSFLQIPIILGVLWFLVVEIIYYIINVHFSKFSWRQVCYLDIITLVMILANISMKNGTISNFIYYFKYISIIMIGSIIYQVEKEEVHKRKMLILLLTQCVLSYGILNINKYYFEDTTAYPHFMTFFVSLMLFMLFYVLSKLIKLKLTKIHKIVKFISDISYPIYLIQLPVGFITMYYIKRYMTNNIYIIVVFSMFMVGLTSYILHRLVETPVKKWVNGRKTD